MKSLPNQVWLLSLCYALMLSGTSMLVLLAGIISQNLAPSPELTTLPVALCIVGLAANSVPSSLLMIRFSRKSIFIFFGIFGALIGLLAGYALMIESFTLFCIAAFFIGVSAATSQKYRFMAIELVEIDKVPAAASAVLMGGICAAFIGPELSIIGTSFFSTPYVGSFILLSCLYLLGTFFLFFLKDRPIIVTEKVYAQRSIRTLLKQHILVIAILSATVGYGVMSFIMTATPLSMHHYFHHSIVDTKWVIQSHIIAMYLPSLFSGYLIRRFGVFNMIYLGLFAFLICVITAFISQSFYAFLIALVLLGFGWNLLFLAGTTLLPQCHSENEKFKAQALNDLVVFSVQALAAASSGWILFKFHWYGLLGLAAIPIGLLILFLMLNKRSVNEQRPDYAV